MKPETEIRNLKREVKNLRIRMDRAERSAAVSVMQKNLAKRAAREWERRFDIAMRKIPDVPDGIEEGV